MKNHEIITQEQWDAVNKGIQILADVVAEVIHCLVDIISELFDKVVKAWDNLILHFANGRVKHLALHAKKYRTRKKNFHRLQKQFMGLLLQGNTKR